MGVPAIRVKIFLNSVPYLWLNLHAPDGKAFKDQVHDFIGLAYTYLKKHCVQLALIIIIVLIRPCLVDSTEAAPKRHSRSHGPGTSALFQCACAFPNITRYLNLD